MIKKERQKFVGMKIIPYLCTRNSARVLIQKQNDAPVAQLVEHLTLNQGVQGSSPCGCTERKKQVRKTCFFSYLHVYIAKITNKYVVLFYSMFIFQYPVLLLPTRLIMPNDFSKEMCLSTCRSLIDSCSHTSFTVDFGF